MRDIGGIYLLCLWVILELDYCDYLKFDFKKLTHGGIRHNNVRYVLIVESDQYAEKEFSSNTLHLGPSPSIISKRQLQVSSTIVKYT